MIRDLCIPRRRCRTDCRGVSAAFGQKSQSSAKDQEAKLIAVLKSDAPRKAKADACRELGRVGTREAVAPLAALLCDEELGHMARYGLEPIPDPAVDTALREALDKVKGRLEVGVIGSIGVRATPRPFALLISGSTMPTPRSCRPPRGLWARSAPWKRSTPWRRPSTRPRGQPHAICEGLFRCCRCSQLPGPAHGGPGRSTRIWPVPWCRSM